MKKHSAGLAEALADNKLMVIYRKAIDAHRLDGYVVGLSDKWVLLHLVDGDVVVPNGYKAVRLADISRIKEDQGFVDEYLRLRGLYSAALPQIRLEDLPSLLRSVSESYSLFMIQCERVEPGIGLVGRIKELTKRSIHLDKIESTAEWIGVEKFKLKDVTCVDFGDGYVEALAWLDAHRKKIESQQ